MKSAEALKTSRSTVTGETRSTIISVIDTFDYPIAIIIAQFDPDAAASAVALKELIATYLPNQDVSIFYCGNIGHPQNRAMVDYCNLTALIQPIQGLLEADPNNYQLALVDSSALRDSRLPKALHQLEPTIVIDHHRNNGILPKDNTLTFTLIEENEVGSTATLLTELFFTSEGNVPISDVTAALLMLGIYTDTGKLESSGTRDQQAFATLSQLANRSLFNRLVHYPLPLRYFDHWETALRHKDIRHAWLITGIGVIPPEDGDDIAVIANEFLRMEGITAAFVWGMVQGSNTIRISARTNNASVSLSEFLRKKFGEKAGAKMAPDGHGEGGALMEFNLPTTTIGPETLNNFIQSTVASIIFS